MSHNTRQQAAFDLPVRGQTSDCVALGLPPRMVQKGSDDKLLKQVVTKLNALATTHPGSVAGRSLSSACSVLIDVATNALTPKVILSRVDQVYRSCLALMRSAAEARENATITPDAKRARLHNVTSGKDEVS